MHSKFSKSKRILKPIVVPAVFLIGLLCFHDDGIPDKLSDADQQYVSRVNSSMEQRMTQVISGMKRFVAEPENQSTICASLATSIDSWYKLSVEIRDDGRFYVITDGTLRHRERLCELYKELGAASDAMASEAVQRCESGAHDEAGYQILTQALKWDLPVRAENAPCDKNNCIWCFYRQTFRLD